MFGTMRVGSRVEVHIDGQGDAIMEIDADWILCGCGALNVDGEEKLVII